MTETNYTRSRRASLGGLIVTLATFATLLGLFVATHSQGVFQLAWYVLGGAPIWFATLLVFRQRELAALEALDLESLRRERASTGAGEALFDAEGAGGAAFRVAEARLYWMIRWLVPGFGLGTALYLGLMGAWLWQHRGMGAATQDAHVALVLVTILAMGNLLLSRYTSGMGRVPTWQMLRGCGAYMLGATIVSAALVICFGVELATQQAGWERTLVNVIPVVMVVLALETLINFVADVYRPKTPGAESRACFDSRLLGLFSEPGGLASSIADAINYQFGFQVSQTWFYKLMERAAIPLVGAGALAMFLLTSIVIVQPYEHAIIERFGRQLNPGGEAADGTALPKPYGPGIHFKLPYPIDIARTYNTGQLHEISVGFKNYSAIADYDEATRSVLLWTDARHLGNEHFDFLICPPPATGVRSPGSDAPPSVVPGDADRTRREAVFLIRMVAAVQYRIHPDFLYLYTQRMAGAHEHVRDVAWEELGRYAVSTTIDDLLGRDLSVIGDVLQRRIQSRIAPYGLEVVYVGLAHVHPEKSVAEAFRKVVQAEQEKVAEIRRALVQENEQLSTVAGNADLARTLATAVMQNRSAEQRANAAERVLASADVGVVEQLSGRLDALAPLYEAHVAAGAALAEAELRQRTVELQYDIGLGSTLADRAEAGQAVAKARAAEQDAAASLSAATEPIRAEAFSRLPAEHAEALLEHAAAKVARGYWREQLDVGIASGRLEGAAAVRLADALSRRWRHEMGAARLLTKIQNEREAYQAAPEVYRARRLMDVLAQGMKDARKFFLAFDPSGRVVRVRIVTDDEVRTDLADMRVRID